MICKIQLNYYFNSPSEMKLTESFIKSNFIYKENYEDTSDNFENRKHSIRSNIGSFNIWMNYNRISLTGSLWKYYHGNNDGEFSNEEVVEAFKKLQFNIPTIDLYKAQFSKIEFGPNFILSQSPDKYSICFEGIKGKKRTVITDKSTTVTIGSDSNQMIIYNKSEESENQIDINILRIEHKLDSNYWRKIHFGDEHPTLNCLISNLDILPEIWYKFYKRIEKNYNPQINLIESISDLRHAAIHNLGYNECRNLIKTSFKTGKLTKGQFDYCKTHINMLQSESKRFAIDTHPIIELDQIIENYMRTVKSNNN